MTTPVCVRQRIRQLDRQGLSHKEISRKLGVSRTTVVKYSNHGDYSPKPSNTARPGRSLVDDGYAAIVDGWPAADLRMPVNRDPRVRAARGRVRVHGLVFVGAALGQALEAGTSSPVGRLRRAGVGPWRRAGRLRPGPWSRAWNGPCISWRCRSRIRTCVGCRHCRAGPRNACARGCWRCSIGRA